jgi:sugar phosphate permease
MVAISLSGVLGNPVAGAISYYLDGVGGWKGWQWILLLEGLPTMLLGLLVLVLLSDGPEHAGWLSGAEREWLQARIEEEQTQVQRKEGRLMDAVSDPRVWLLIAVYCTVAVGTNAAGAYLPKLIRQRFEGEDDRTLGFLLALPHLCAIVGMTLLGAHSDRTGERRGHVALAAFVAAGGWVLALHADPRLALVGFCLAQMGMMSMLPVFWAMPTAFLGGVAAAGGIALINSIANLGGLFGPTILGEATRLGRELFSVQDGGLIAMAIILFVGGVLVLFARKE